jgi:hypothetical protein
MKAVAALIFIVSIAAGASAQNSAQPNECPDVKVQDFAWGVAQRMVFSEDPRFKPDSSGRPVNTKDNPINSVGSSVNMTGVPLETAPVRPQGTPRGFQIPVAENKSDTVQTIETRRETYMLVKNAGNKIIKKISWDYVFFSDAAMQQELKRHQFKSKKKIAPGEAKFLSEYVVKRAPSRYQRVFISRVEFGDGSIWPGP